MKKTSIIISSISVTLLMLFIKFLGVIKQSVMASVCGASMESDSFFVASGIISSLSVALFSAISISLLTTYSQVKNNEGQEKANKIINCSIKVFLPATAILVVIINALAYPIAQLLAPSYTTEALLVFATYIRILSITLIPSCFYLILNVTLENKKVFLPGKLNGLFLNLFLIIATLCFYKQLGVISLVIAFVLAIVTQAVFVFFISRKDFGLSFKKTECMSYVKRILLLSLPLIIGNAVYEINDIVDKKIALSIGDGAASILTYGASVNEIVTGVIVSSISVVIFANFASLVASKEIDKLIAILKNTLLCLFIFILPIMIICCFSGTSLVKILYERGEFSPSDVTLTSQVVLGYAVGFIFQAIRSILIKVYYAFNKVILPTVTGFIAVSLNITLSIILSKSLGVLGIALATSISMALTNIILFAFVKKLLPDFKITSLLPESLKSILAIIISGTVFYLLNEFTSYNVYAEFIVNCLVLAILYFACLLLFKSKPLLLFINKIKNRRPKNDSQSS